MTRCLVVLLVLATATAARAETPLPSTLTLDAALARFRREGFDLLIADAEVASAQGDVRIADAIPNPALSLTYGRSFYSCAMCAAPPALFGVQVSDQGALEDALAGKRRLREDVATAALRAAKLSRGDAERTLVFEVKAQFEQVLVAQLSLKFARDTAQANATLLEKTQEQAAAGKIGDADVLRVKALKLESDQALDQGTETLRKARAQLAYLLGVRTAPPEFTVEDEQLSHYVLPAALASGSHDQLLATALANRPDVRAQRAALESARAQASLDRRNRFPDIALSVGYSQQGTDPAAPSPPTVSVGLSAPIPLLYQRQGEIAKADAAVRVQELTLAKLQASIVADVETAWADFQGAQALVRRMEEGELLATARAAKDAVIRSKELGVATLLDVLLAMSTYIATNVEYENDVAAYWTAVFELERAVGQDLR